MKKQDWYDMSKIKNISIFLLVASLLGSVTLSSSQGAPIIFLPELIDDSPFVLHVKVLKGEEPFGEGNNSLRFVLCEVLTIVKSINITLETVNKPKDDESLNYIVTLMKNREICPVEVGKEYVLFCQGGILTPVVVGVERIFLIEDGMVSAYVKDFPKIAKLHDPTKTVGKGIWRPRTKVPIIDFLKRAREISRGEHRKVGAVTSEGNEISRIRKPSRKNEKSIIETPSNKQDTPSKQKNDVIEGGSEKGESNGYLYLNYAKDDSVIFIGDNELLKMLKTTKCEPIILDYAVMEDAIKFFNDELKKAHGIELKADKEIIDRWATIKAGDTLLSLIQQLMHSSYSYAEIRKKTITLKSYGKDQEERNREPKPSNNLKSTQIK